MSSRNYLRPYTKATNHRQPPHRPTKYDYLLRLVETRRLHTLQTFTTQTSNSKGWTSQSTTSLRHTKATIHRQPPHRPTKYDYLLRLVETRRLHTLQTFTTQTSNSKGWTSQSTTSLLGDGRHKIFKCSIFIAQSPEQMTTRNSGLCFNSLNKDHRIANCPSKKNCQHSNCNERHNTLLHRHFQIAGNSSHLTKRQGFRTVNKNQPSEASHNKSQSHRENTTLVHLSQKESTNSCFQRKTDAENYRTETHQPAATLQTSPINLQNQHLQSHEQQLFEDVKSWWKMESYGPRAQEQDNTKWFLPHYRIVSPAKPGKTRRIANAAAVFNGTCLNDHLLDDLVGIILRSREKPILITTDIGISCKLESEKIFGTKTSKNHRRNSTKDT